MAGKRSRPSIWASRGALSATFFSVVIVGWAAAGAWMLFAPGQQDDEVGETPPDVPGAPSADLGTDSDSPTGTDPSSRPPRREPSSRGEDRLATPGPTSSFLAPDGTTTSATTDEPSTGEPSTGDEQDSTSAGDPGGDDGEETTDPAEPPPDEPSPDEPSPDEAPTDEASTDEQPGNGDGEANGIGNGNGPGSDPGRP